MQKIDRKRQREARDFDEKMIWYASRYPFDEDRQEQLSNVLTDYGKDMFEFGKKEVALEMNKDVPPTANETLGLIKSSNNKLIKKISGDLKKRVEASKDIINAKSPKAFREGLIRQFLFGLKTFCIDTMLNLGRGSTMNNYEDDVQAIQFSAILDDRTSEVCKNLDGKVVELNSAEMRKIEPPMHFNCRSIFVEILRDEVDIPEFSEIPEEEQLIDMGSTRTSEIQEMENKIRQDIREEGSN